MIWFRRMKLRLLPVIDPQQITKDILALTEISPDIANRMTMDESVYEEFNTIDAMFESEFFFTWAMSGKGTYWKRVGSLLVLFQFTERDRIIGLGPLPWECVVRIGKSKWRKYDLLKLHSIAKEQEQ